MKKLLLFMCCAMLSLGITMSSVSAQSGQAPKAKLSASKLDEMGQRTFRTADEDHNKALNSKEFQKSERLIDNAIRKMQEDGTIGVGAANAKTGDSAKGGAAKNNNAKNSNGKNAKGKGAGPAASKSTSDSLRSAKTLAESEILHEEEFVRYFRSRIDTADQKIRDDLQAQQQAQQKSQQKAQQQQMKAAQNQQKNAQQRAQRQAVNAQRNVINSQQRAIINQQKAILKQAQPGK